MVGKKTLSLPISAKWQCAIWDNTALVKISALHDKCTALKCTVFKYTNRSMRFGTHNFKHVWKQEGGWRRELLMLIKKATYRSLQSDNTILKKVWTYKKTTNKSNCEEKLSISVFWLPSIDLLKRALTYCHMSCIFICQFCTESWIHGCELGPTSSEIGWDCVGQCCNAEPL